MPKAAPLQGNFLGGEVSPLFFGRTDSPQYKISLAICLNQIPTIQGALTRRPGTYFVAEVNDSSKFTRLIPFRISSNQAFALEFGDTYIRFFKNDAPVLLSGVPYVLTGMPWTTADLPLIQFAQSADTMYLVHPKYLPWSLTRIADNNWSPRPVAFFDGPYLDPNTGNLTTLSAGGAAGAGSNTIVTASSTTGINGGVGFLATDVGRHIRMKSLATGLWSAGIIVTFTDSTHVLITVETGITPNGGASDKTSSWRLGAWSDTTGYPGSVVFHQDRLVFGGAAVSPQRIDGSNTDDFLNFQPTAVDGTVTDNMSFSFEFNSSDVATTEWLLSGFRGLNAGTNGGEWLITPPPNTSALSPTQVSTQQVTRYGDAAIQPVQIADAVIFVDRSSRKIRELTFVYYIDGYQAPDLTQNAEHITQSGISAASFQTSPQPILWCVRNDGVLAAMTYERQFDALKVAWSRHQIGGTISGGAPAVVESLVTIPFSDGSRDEVWMIVRRTINGATKRYVEVMAQFFDDTVKLQDAFFVDAGLTYDSPLTLTAVTQANPAVLTSAAHGLSNGNRVLISDILGMTDLNDSQYLVVGVTTNTFELTDLLGNAIDSTGFGTYISGGFARKMVMNISGLDHLEGQTVSILADGAEHPDQVVSSGAITLEFPAAVVQVGLGYNSDGQLLRLDAGSADGTSFGKKRRTHRVGFMLHRSLGLKFGMNFNELDEVTFRTTNDPMNRATPLFSGIVSENIPADYDFENQVCWRQDRPLPLTITAVMPQMETQDRQ